MPSHSSTLPQLLARAVDARKWALAPEHHCVWQVVYIHTTAHTHINAVLALRG